MARPLGRAITAASVLLACVLASVLACLLVLTVGPGAEAPAGAQSDECLPPPTLIYGEIAQVAGTNSQLWADVQAVEQAEEASGTEGSGQVIQDMLAVINRDGYQWDCATDQLEADVAAAPISPGIPTIPDTPAGATTPPSTPPAGAATTAGAPAAAPPATSGGAGGASGAGGSAGASGASGAGGAGTTIATLGDPGLANSAPVGVGQSTNGAPSGQVASPLALAAGTNSSSDRGTGELSTAALGLLALVTAALLVLVVRWQMGRR